MPNHHPLGNQDLAWIEALLLDGCPARDVVDHVVNERYRGSPAAVYRRIKRFHDFGSVYNGYGSPGRPKVITAAMKETIFEAYCRKSSL